MLRTSKRVGNVVDVSFNFNQPPLANLMVAETSLNQSVVSQPLPIYIMVELPAPFVLSSHLIPLSATPEFAGPPAMRNAFQTPPVLVPGVILMRCAEASIAAAPPT